MRAFNDLFASYAPRSTLVPRFVARLSFDKADTDYLYLTNSADADTPTGATVVHGCIGSGGISGLGQKINPSQGVATIGDVTLTLIDHDGSVSDHIATKRAAGYGIRHKKLRLFLGYEDMPWEAYELLLTFIVTDHQRKDGKITLKAEDIQRAERQQICVPHVTNLVQTVAADADLIPVAEGDASQFPTVAHGDEYRIHPDQSVAYVRLDDEIIAHTGIIDNPAGGKALDVLQRGAFGTIAATHEVDTEDAIDQRPEIKEYIYIEGPALKVALLLMNGEYDGDTLPDHWHAGIDADDVRITDYEEAGADLWDPNTGDGLPVSFAGLDNEDAKRLIEKEIMVWLNCYRPIYSNGQIGLRRGATILSDSPSDVTLTHDDVVDYSDIREELGDLANNISVVWDHDPVTGEPRRRTELLDADSIDQHGKAPLREFTFRGVNTSQHSQEQLNSYFDMIRDRHAGPPLTMSVTVMPHHANLEVGDVVRLQLDAVTDPVTDAPLDRPFEVQSVSTTWRTGARKLRLFASSQAAGTTEPTGAVPVLDDDFYAPPASGTNASGLTADDYKPLTDFLTIDGSGEVTADGTIDWTSAPAETIFGETVHRQRGVVYYHGDLTIPAGVTVTIKGTVVLLVRGFLTVNGTIDGEGGAESTTYPRFRTRYGADSSTYQRLLVHNTNGNNDHFEVIYATGGFDFITNYHDGNQLISNPARWPNRFALNNQGGYLLGADLTHHTGHDGGEGGPRYTDASFDSDGWATTTPTDGVPAGAAGKGGAGLVIVARGGSLGPAAVINTSGTQGGAGGSTSHGDNVLMGANGTNGAPGAVYWLMDGPFAAVDLGSAVQAQYPEVLELPDTVGLLDVLDLREAEPATPGATIYGILDHANGRSYKPPEAGTNYALYWDAGHHHGPDAVSVAAMTSFQYIPNSGTVDPNWPPPQKEPVPAAITIDSVTTGSDELRQTVTGDLIAGLRVHWSVPDTTVAQNTVAHFEVQERLCSQSNTWQAVAFVGPDADNYSARMDATAGQDYKLRVRAIPQDNSQHLPTDWVETDCTTAAGNSTPPATPANLAWDDGANKLTWDANTESDLAGYLVRTNSSDDWASGTPVTDDDAGLIINPPTALKSNTASTNKITFDPAPTATWLLVRAYNTSGTESAAASIKIVETTFDPAPLFASGEEGAFWDFNDKDTLYSDTGRTTAATIAGAVFGVTDKSGNGQHLEANGGGITMRDGWIETADQRLVVPGSGATGTNYFLFLQTSNGGEIFIGVKPDNTGASMGLMGNCNHTSSDRGVHLAIETTGDLEYYYPASTATTDDNASYSDFDWNTVFARHGTFGGTDEKALIHNTTEHNFTVDTFTGATTSNRDFAVGSISGAASVNLTGKMVFAGVIDRALTPTERQNLRDYLNEVTGT
ncbi:MAG: hypothetical protein ACQES2_00725 [Pseudomonadota bacterium]